MKKRIFLTLLVAMVATAAAGQSATRQATADSTPPINLALNALMMAAIPEPADDPLLDATGAPVLDATGHPVSDPNEGFHKVIPQVFDPAHTHLAQSTWLDGIGCPTSTNIEFFVPPNFNTTAAGTYKDGACPTGDPKDKHNEGLLMVKTGPTNNNAAAVAVLKKVRGIHVTELGYDLRKTSPTLPQGSHCGAGAPRFNVVTSDDVLHFIGCNSPPAMVTNTSASSTNTTPGAEPEFGWVRLRWDPVTAFPPVLPTDTVKQISIVFDEGQDASGGPDSFGAAILDNIDVNTKLVGRGPMGQGMKDDERGDDDDDD
jgi:hypothetical protein